MRCVRRSSRWYSMPGAYHVSARGGVTDMLESKGQTRLTRAAESTWLAGGALIILLTTDLFSRPDGVVFAVVFLGLLAAGTAYVLWRSRRQARA